MQQYYEIIV